MMRTLTLAASLALLLCIVLPEGVAAKKRSASAGVARGKQTAVMHLQPLPLTTTSSVPARAVQSLSSAGLLMLCVTGSTWANKICWYKVLTPV